MPVDLNSITIFGVLMKDKLERTTIEVCIGTIAHPFQVFFFIFMVAGRMFQHSCPCHRAPVYPVYNPDAFLSVCERKSVKPDHPFWPFCFLPSVAADTIC